MRSKKRNIFEKETTHTKEFRVRFLEDFTDESL